MANSPDYYPPSPDFVPDDLTRPSVRYRRQINLVSSALLLFFFVYGAIVLLCLIIAAALIFRAKGAFVVPGLLFLVPAGVLIKALFARQKWGKGYEIEIYPDEHPRLFEFLECVCEEVDAPMPDGVLVNHEVNASAGCPISLMSLFKQPKRELILGLGLVNAINMTEFKCLLAHEFGHLSQFDMKSAPFVRLGVQVVANILSQYRPLEWMFILTIKLHLKLSREMEFHADLTAVSATGSDAVPQLLFKALWADHCMQQTISDLERTREHDLHSEDVFVHQLAAARHVRQRRKDPTIGRPPRLPAERDQTVQMFKPDEDEMAVMWEGHPSNFDRELNAKARYVRTDFVEQSPWMLFDDVKELRRAVTVKFYKQNFNVKKSVEWNAASDVQAFLDEEFAETNFDFNRYGVLYNHRNLQPIDLRAVTEAKERNAPADLLASHRSLYSPDVRKFAEIYLRHSDEFQLVRAVENRWFEPKDGEYKIRGRRFKKRSAKKLLKQLDRELAADVAWLERFDTRVFVTYYELALALDETRAEELWRRYRFHFVLQNLWTKLRDQEGPMGFVFDFIASLQAENTLVDDDSFHFVIEVFRNAYDAAKYVLEQSELARFPELVNMPAGEPVRGYLLKGSLPSKPTHFDESLRGKWLTKFADKFREMQKKLDRLHFKSLGAILSLQEQIGAAAEARWKT